MKAKKQQNSPWPMRSPMSRSFVEVLSEINHGNVVDDLTSRLASVVEGVIATDKKGALTLTVEVTPNGDGSVQVVAKIKAVIPDPTRGTTIMFVQEDNSLGRNDPRQGRLDLDRPSLAPVRLHKD
jgi:hypothetical protein